MTGKIFDIQRFSVHDGPGIRTTVFMKGCPLRCLWCHNPEGLENKIQLKYNKNECIECGLCGEKSLKNTLKCPTGAIATCGQEIDETELLKEIVKDINFYGDEGGVTFSGGECLSQADFVTNVLKMCKEKGINTAVDTCGYVPFKSIEKTLPYCDLYLYDIKAISKALHIESTGVDNKIILENLKKLAFLTDKIQIRVPIIPKINDTDDEMKKIADTVSALGIKLPVTLIPYHGLSESKYEFLGLKCLYTTDYKITAKRLGEIDELFLTSRK